MQKTSNQALAANLKRYMDARGLSCLALSKLAKVAANTIGNYLDTEAPVTATGKERSAKLTEVEKLARALGVTVAQMLDDGEPGGAPPPVGGLDDLTLLELARDLAMLTPARRSVLLDAIHQEAEAAREVAFLWVRGVCYKIVATFCAPFAIFCLTRSQSFANILPSHHRCQPGERSATHPPDRQQQHRPPWPEGC